MKPKRVTIKEARAEHTGKWCPSDTRYACTSCGPHTEWATPSGKVYTKCSKCDRSFNLRGG